MPEQSSANQGKFLPLVVTTEQHRYKSSSQARGTLLFGRPLTVWLGDSLMTPNVLPAVWVLSAHLCRIGKEESLPDPELMELPTPAEKGDPCSALDMLKLVNTLEPTRHLLDK